MSRYLSIFLLVALVATGCGKTESPTSVDTPTRVTAPAMPTPSVPAGPATGNAAALVQAMQAAWGTVKTLSGHYDSWEKNASEVETNKVDFWFQKPGTYRLEVSDATEALKRGSKSVFSTRTRKISSRPGGALSFVKLDGTLDDARSKSVRGYTLDQTDYQTLTAMLLANAPALKLVPNRPYTLELPNPPKFAGVEALRATLDPQKMVPIYFEMSEHGQLCATRKFTKLNLNPAIGSDKFTL